MTTMIIAAKGTLKPKPKYGDPCNGCGICCIATTCLFGQAVLKHDDSGPCPAFEMGAGCGLILHPERHKPFETYVYGAAQMSGAAHHIVSAGTGCDTSTNDDPPDPAFDQKMLTRWRKFRDLTDHAWRLWGVTSHG